MSQQSRVGPSGPRVETTRKGVEYLLRPYEAGDADRIEPLLGPLCSGDFEPWFRHTYLENPYVDHVPMFVAEADVKSSARGPLPPTRSERVRRPSWPCCTGTPWSTLTTSGEGCSAT